MKETLIEMVEKIIDTGPIRTISLLPALKSLIRKYKHYTPTVYLTIHKGMIVGVHSTEKVVISIQNRDNLKDVDNQDVGVWEHMIEQGLNSGELISIKLHK